MTQPNCLFLDIETSPILADVWDIWEQNIPLNQIKKDWNILAWGAKWLGSKTVEYRSLRHSKNMEDDSSILLPLWDILDKADVVITHNGKKFDSKRINTRMVINGIKPPSPYKQIDTLEIAKKHFDFTSNKLEYLANILKVKHPKLDHSEFPGYALWRECIARNPKAWDCMKKYNIRDVVTLEDVYEKLQPWDTSINFSDWYKDWKCNCGSKRLRQNGQTGVRGVLYQRYQCADCGRPKPRSKEDKIESAATREKRA